MKRLLAWAVAAALVLSLGATGVLAAGGCRKGSRCACRLGYVDQNGDGVCDNCLALGRTGRVSAACGGCGQYYVDQNGDGVCDNCPSGGVCQSVSAVCGGCGRSYVDQNGDGVCDNCPSGGTCQSAGGGHHHRQSCHR